MRNWKRTFPAKNESFEIDWIVFVYYRFSGELDLNQQQVKHKCMLCMLYFQRSNLISTAETEKITGLNIELRRTNCVRLIDVNALYTDLQCLRNWNFSRILRIFQTILNPLAKYVHHTICVKLTRSNYRPFKWTHSTALFFNRIFSLKTNL